nr:hypothetical protein [sulfur-oxidizing endosymbiont of Gigantopelta aegis]
MKKAGLFCKTKRRFKATTNSKHNKRISPNLLEREFTVSQPDRDITYTRLLYLVVIFLGKLLAGRYCQSMMKAGKPMDGLLLLRGSQYALIVIEKYCDLFSL